MSITQSSTRLTALVAGVAVAAALIAGAFAATPAQAAALTQSQISSIISLLQSFGADATTIANVQASLNGQPTSGTGGTTATGGACYAWTRDLQQGSTGADVMALQKFLNGDPATMVAVSGAGSPGNETSTFGPATKAAVIKFQTKYNITPIAGYFGPKSQAQANVVCGGSTGGNTGGNTGTGAAVVSAAAQPANAIAPQGASRVPFTAFTVTANGSAVTLNSVTVQRQGPSLDTDFSGVVLVDASTGVQLGTARVLDANHSATIGSPITIPAGTSKTFWVAGNIAALSGSIPGSGDVASFAVTAVNTNSTVSGSLPIVGASNTINTALSIGTAQIQTSSYDPNSASSQPIGTSGYRFSGVRIQAGSAEDVTFKSITWYQSGSASGLQNVMTYVNGTSYPTTIDSTGRYYTTVFPSGIVIPKGQSVDVYVQGDLGANTTANTYAEFDVYRNTDIYLVGNTYGYGVTPTIASYGSPSTNGTHGSAFAAANTNQPFFQGSTLTITAGTFSTIQNATAVGAQNIAINVPNQPLGGFQTNLTGEALQVQSLKVHFTTSGNMLPLQNISLVDENGAVVSGPYNATCDSVTNSPVTGACGTTQYVTFTGATNFPTGTHTYTLKGQVQTQSSINGYTIQANTNPTSDWNNITGATTGNTVTPGVTNFTMNTMTIQSASAVITNGTSPTSQTIVAGGQNIRFATIQIDASQSGEDVRLSSLPLQLTLANYATSTDLSNCQLWNGSTALNTGSRVVNSSQISSTVQSATTINPVTFSFDNALTVTKGTVLQLGLTCNVTSSASPNAQYTWAASATSGNYSVTGVTSGSTVTIATPTGNAPVMTVATGAALAGSTDSSSPSYALVAGGTTGVTVNVIKLRASNEPVNLQKVGLKLANNSTNPSDITTAYIYAGNNVYTTAGTAIAAGTQIGTVVFTAGSATATSTLSQVVQLPVNTDATLIVKADIADIGVSQPGTEGDLVTVNYDSSRGTGANSGKTIDGTGNGATSQGIRIFNTFPTIALGSLPTSGVAGDGQLIRFSVTADSHGTLGVGQFVFNIASSTGVTVSNLALYAYSDSNYSIAANGTSGGVAVASPTINSNGTVATTTLSTPIQVAPNAPVYFLLKGTVNYSGTNSTYNISTTLKGDAAAIGVINGTTAEANYSFVWSPNATSTSAITGTGSGDWTNGNGVIGLPSIGVTQSRSN
ncbi:MAG TPA: peptidoglycan-binding domain-containing protein [Candidatus Paceibacterota bacterium]|nr:peptidoglycan-binding domain-containing protein [Candidatus Paceibacterota bacterium]